eukprot:jgi/Picre1/32054/NNA_007402.t1
MGTRSPWEEFRQALTGDAAFFDIIATLVAKSETPTQGKDVERLLTILFTLGRSQTGAPCTEHSCSCIEMDQTIGDDHGCSRDESNLAQQLADQTSGVVANDDVAAALVLDIYNYGECRIAVRTEPFSETRCKLFPTQPNEAEEVAASLFPDGFQGNDEYLKNPVVLARLQFILFMLQPCIDALPEPLLIHQLADTCLSLLSVDMLLLQRLQMICSAVCSLKRGWIRVKEDTIYISCGGEAPLLLFLLRAGPFERGKG